MRAIRTSQCKERRNKETEALLCRQHGVITRRQLAELGHSASVIYRRMKSGGLVRVHEGVFRSSAFPVGYLQSVAAACLALGEQSAASHRSAAFLLGLEGINADVIEVSVLTGTRSSLARVVVHRTNSLAPCDRTVLDGVPATNAPRTLLDLGAVVDEESLELALEDALRRRLTSIARLEWRIAQLCGRGRPGCSALRRLLDQRRSNRPTESALETKLARLIRNSDLPTPLRQYEVVSAGTHVARVDFAYPHQKVAVEADGYRWHSGRRDWERELRRRNELQRLGWAVVHVTSADIRDTPEEVLDGIRTALRSRGLPTLF